MLARNRGLTITVLLTFAIGIGANTAIFTVDYATLLAPLPYPEADQLVMVWSDIQSYHHTPVAIANFLDWKRQSTVFQDLCAWSPANFNLATKDNPEYVTGNEATYGMLQMVGEPLFMGRYFLPEEGLAGRDHVVIITHRLWVGLGSNPSIIGTTLRLNDDATRWSAYSGKESPIAVNRSSLSPWSSGRSKSITTSSGDSAWGGSNQA